MRILILLGLLMGPSVEAKSLATSTNATEESVGGARALVTEYAPGIYGSNTSCACEITFAGGRMLVEFRGGTAWLDNCNPAGPYFLSRVGGNVFKGDGLTVEVLTPNQFLVHRNSKRYLFRWANSL